MRFQPEKHFSLKIRSLVGRASVWSLLRIVNVDVLQISSSFKLAVSMTGIPSHNMYFSTPPLYTNVTFCGCLLACWAQWISRHTLCSYPSECCLDSIRLPSRCLACRSSSSLTRALGNRNVLNMLFCSLHVVASCLVYVLHLYYLCTLLPDCYAIRVVVVDLTPSFYWWALFWVSVKHYVHTLHCWIRLAQHRYIRSG